MLTCTPTQAKRWLPIAKASGLFRDARDMKALREISMAIEDPQVGMRVRVTPAGHRWYRMRTDPARQGDIVHIVGSTCHVLWDGRKTPAPIHRHLLKQVHV